jgi:hypothetical protein
MENPAQFCVKNNNLLLCRIEKRPPKLDLDIYPYLPRANVATTSPASYKSLMAEGQS